MGKNVETTMENPFVDRTVEVHALTRGEEEECYKDLKQRALKKCEPAIKEFVQCSKDHNITVMWTCRTLLKSMNACLNGHTSRDEFDKLKLAKLAEKRSQRLGRQTQD